MLLFRIVAILASLICVESSTRNYLCTSSVIAVEIGGLVRLPFQMSWKQCLALGKCITVVKCILNYNVCVYYQNYCHTLAWFGR